MPNWLALILIGIIVVCAAYYVVLPPPIKSVLMFIGVALLIVGAILFAVALLALAGVRLPG